MLDNTPHTQGDTHNDKADEITGGTRRHSSLTSTDTRNDRPERVDQLERRLTQAETLLNDVMQQLDKPYRDQPLCRRETPSQRETNPQTGESGKASTGESGEAPAGEAPADETEKGEPTPFATSNRTRNTR